MAYPIQRDVLFVYRTKQTEQARTEQRQTLIVKKQTQSIKEQPLHTLLNNHKSFYGLFVWHIVPFFEQGSSVSPDGFHDEVKIICVSSGVNTIRHLHHWVGHQFTRMNKSVHSKGRCHSRKAAGKLHI